VILIDGFDWEGPAAEVRESLGRFKATANELGAKLWLTAQTHREETSDEPTVLTRPCAEFADLIDVAIFLAPQGSHVGIRILKGRQNRGPVDTHIELDPVLLRIVDAKSA